MRINRASVSPVPGCSLLQVELSIDDRLAGRALCSGVAPQHLLGLAEAVLVGRDPRGVSGLWDLLGAADRNDPSPAAARARAALDIACWDLKARINDEPLWKTLGGSRPRAVAYGSWPATPEAANQPIDDFAPLTSKGGFHRGLLRLGGDPVQDRHRLRLLHDALGAAGRPVELMADFDGIWPDEAIRRIAALEADFDLVWVKGVTRAGDHAGCGRVASQIRAAVCAGGDLCTERAFLPLLNPQCANVIEIDVQRLGMTGSLRVAEAAFGYELPVALSAAPGNLPVHLSSVLPGFMGMEVVDAAGRADAVRSAVRIEGGRAWAGDEPGTGIGIEGNAGA